MGFLLLSGILVGCCLLQKTNNITGIGSMVESVSIDDLLFDRHKLNKKYDYFEIFYEISVYGVSRQFEDDAFDVIALVRDIDEKTRYIQSKKGFTLRSIHIAAYSNRKRKKMYVII